MRLAIFLAALACLTAPLAHAQTAGLGEVALDPDKAAAVYFRPGSSESPEAITMARLVYQSLQDSRDLERVDRYDETVVQLEAPVSVAGAAAGKDMVVTFEVTPVRGVAKSFSTTCPADRLDRCAELIVMRTERMVREDLYRP